MAYTINSTSQRQRRRSFRFGVLNGILFSLFGSLLDPSLVLSWFVSQLATSSFLIGLIMPIQNGGWFLPQLVISGHVQTRQRKFSLLTLSNELEARTCFSLPFDRRELNA